MALDVGERLTMASQVLSMVSMRFSGLKVVAILDDVCQETTGWSLRKDNSGMCYLGEKECLGDVLRGRKEARKMAIMLSFKLKSPQKGKVSFYIRLSEFLHLMCLYEGAPLTNIPNFWYGQDE